MQLKFSVMMQLQLSVMTLPLGALMSCWNLTPLRSRLHSRQHYSHKAYFGSIISTEAYNKIDNNGFRLSEMDATY